MDKNKNNVTSLLGRIPKMPFSDIRLALVIYRLAKVVKQGQRGDEAIDNALTASDKKFLNDNQALVELIMADALRQLDTLHAANPGMNEDRENRPAIPSKYQFREIGESEWESCTHEWFVLCHGWPEFETRVVDTSFKVVD